MNKYKKLISNTVIFAIGTFSSKLLVFLLMPFYTRVLTTEELGTGDLVAQAANLLIPLVTLGIVNGIIRFGLDKASKKSDVLSTGLIVILGGFLVLLPFYPLIDLIPMTNGYTILLYLYVLASSMRSLFSQFVRVSGYVRLYALDGILSTAMTILFNILFLMVFSWGITGYVLATICADACSSLFLFFVASLWKRIKFQRIRKKTASDMVKYSIPLIPNMICWWITNTSDKFVVAHFLGEGANGLLTAAYKLPNIITIASTFFMDAWQMSAVTEEKDRADFFTKVFQSFCAIVFMGASALIALSRFIMGFFVGPDFFEAWKYVPFLAIATVFSCLVNFLGSVYTVEKKSVLSMVTMIAGAAANLILNIVLTPLLGIQGAALATILSYMLVFVLRLINTRKYIKMDMNLPKIIFCTLLLLTQSLLMIFEVSHWAWLECGLVILMLAINLRGILSSVKKVLRRG